MTSSFGHIIEVGCVSGSSNVICIFNQLFMAVVDADGAMAVHTTQTMSLVLFFSNRKVL